MFHFASTFPTQFLGRFRAPRAQLAPFSYLLLLIGHMQTIFESKGDELSSSAECGIWTQTPEIARWQTDWAMVDQAKKKLFDSPSLWGLGRHHFYR